MEFLFFLGGLIALLLGTDTATKGLSGALQQAGGSALAAALVLVACGYALPGLALVGTALSWRGLGAAVVVAHGSFIGVAGLGAAGLLLGTGVVLRVRPWRMLDDDKAREELAEFAASRPGWARNAFRLLLGILLLGLGARGLIASAPLFAVLPGGGEDAPLLLAAAAGVGAAVAVVASFHARFGDAAAAFAALLGAGSVLALLATVLAFAHALPVPGVGLLAHPLLHGALLLGLLAALGRPRRPVARGAAYALLVATAGAVLLSLRFG